MSNIKKVGMCFITLITLLITVSIIFIVNNNIKESKNKTSSENNNSLTKEEKSDLMNFIDIYDNYLITFDGTKDISTLTDLEKINFIDRLPYDVLQKEKLDFVNGVSLKKVEMTLKKYFGNDTTFTPVNSKCFLDDLDYLIYDSSTKTYKIDASLHGHSAYQGPEVVNYYLKGERVVDNDKLIYKVTLKKAFAYPNTSIYYANYTDLKNSNNEVIDLYTKYNDYEKEDIPELLEEYIDELTTYTYIFETKDSIENSYLIELVNNNSQQQF